MDNRIICAAAIFVLAVSAAYVPADAWWVEDGVAVCDDSAHQFYPMIVQDDSGGFIVIWMDQRSGNDDLYAQKFNVSGTPLWADNGVPVTTDPAGLNIAYVEAISDNRGGIIVAWTDHRSSSDDIYAQRIGADGTPRWTVDGHLICGYTADQRYPQLVPDGTGGAIILWEDWRNGHLDAYGQRIDAGGVIWWTSSGTSICGASGNQTWIRACSDGSGGVIAAWMDLRSGTYHIYAQRLNGNGVIQWINDGIAVCTAGHTGNPDIISDGAGGAFITWMDQRAGPSDIYAQRLDAAGSAQWAANGLPVAVEANVQAYSYQVLDGAGGMVVSWIDERAGGTYDIYAQRLNGSGAPQWTTNGVLLESRPQYQYDPRPAPDGTGGAIVTWTDNDNIYAQRIDGTGTVQWDMEGIYVCGRTFWQDECRIISDGDGGAYITWHDQRAASYDIYAAHLEPDGQLYDVPPAIAYVDDITADQGGYVYVAWDASWDEFCNGNRVTHYTVWRAIDPAAAILARDSGRPMVEAGSGIVADIPIGTVRTEILDGAPWYWELVATQYLYYQDTYGLPVSTFADSVGTETGWHYFQVVAQTDDPMVYYASEPDSGYSVDNLAPAPPLGLAGEQLFSPEGLELTWDPNTEPDLLEYRIYRDTDPTFEPGPGSFVTSTPDTFSFDGEWSWDSGYAYKVTAVDIHGNESLWAMLLPSGVTGDDPMPVPDATFLAQNYPNPFNPNTTIAFGLKSGGHVSLRIYDAAGRLVMTLVDESRPAGSYTAEWNGINTYGSSVSSGVYFYRLISKEFEETRKMILLR